VDELTTIDEAHCLIVSQIGKPLEQPHAVDVAVRVASGLIEPRTEILAIVADELAQIGSIAKELAGRAMAIGRWPLRGEAM
jgi:S-adenosylmethionine synthetase